MAACPLCNKNAGPTTILSRSSGGSCTCTKTEMADEILRGRRRIASLESEIRRLEAEASKHVVSAP